MVITVSGYRPFYEQVFYATIDWPFEADERVEYIQDGGIIKTDKRRASYYEYYSAKRWGAVDSYDFCLDSSYLGLSGTVELVRTMVEQRENPIPSPTEIDPTR